ncbi:MAG: acylphosphatase [Pseudonocardiales bacterium]
MGESARLDAWVDGRVQGVGYRYWIRSRARDLGLRGSATNLPDGRVAVMVQGPPAACQSLLEAMASDDAPGWVGKLVHSWGEPGEEPDGFRIG